MARGFAIPVGVTGQGRIAMVEGDEQAEKIIGLALSDTENENAFQQDEGLGQDMVFDIQGPLFRAKILTRLLDIFREFERLKLYALDRASITWETIKEGQGEPTRGVQGDVILTFSYVNLETDEEKLFRRNFSDRAQQP